MKIFKETTEKVKRLIAAGMSAKSLSQHIGITPPTLYKRLYTDDWKIGEIKVVESLPEIPEIPK